MISSKRIFGIIFSRYERFRFQDCWYLILVLGDGKDFMQKDVEVFYIYICVDMKRFERKKDS